MMLRIFATFIIIIAVIYVALVFNQRENLPGEDMNVHRIALLTLALFLFSIFAALVVCVCRRILVHPADENAVRNELELREFPVGNGVGMPQQQRFE